MKFNFFDIHSHFNLEAFEQDRSRVIDTLEEKKVGTICVGIDKNSSEISTQLANQSSNIFACVGLHPQEVSNESMFDYEFYKQLATEPRVVCIGECGLDYFRIRSGDDTIKQLQRVIFKEQIQLALDVDLPLMLHIRPSVSSYDAYDEVLAILDQIKEQAGERLRGNAHFFAGTAEHAKRFNQLGFTISFTGVITFTKDYDQVVREVPLEYMFAETDAPFVAPTPYRGKRAEPWMVEQVYRKIADIKGISVERVTGQLAENRKRLFGI